MGAEESLEEMSHDDAVAASDVVDDSWGNRDESLMRDVREIVGWQVGRFGRWDDRY